eukprot:TRINITY_DN5678_c0_g1_i1.p1 TRINITY_DN5678_c0_g1~~TRINITY_DN5678_c0_g1_i1.p1  ORF type:complete len:215 (-),score=22.77 TRINITY_DN5678_c0_g1_i1:95-706(-)
MTSSPMVLAEQPRLAGYGNSSRSSIDATAEALKMTQSIKLAEAGSTDSTESPALTSDQLLIQRLLHERQAQREEILSLRDAFVDVLEEYEIHQLQKTLQSPEAEVTISSADRLRIRTSKKQLWNQLIHITKHRRQAARQRRSSFEEVPRQQQPGASPVGTGTCSGSSTEPNRACASSQVLSRPLSGPYVVTHPSLRETSGIPP